MAGRVSEGAKTDYAGRQELAIIFSTNKKKCKQRRQNLSIVSKKKQILLFDYVGSDISYIAMHTLAESVFLLLKLSPGFIVIVKMTQYLM